MLVIHHRHTSGTKPDENEPPRDKTNKMIFAPSEDSDQRAQSDQSLRCPHEETLGPQLPIECTTKTGRKPRLI